MSEVLWMSKAPPRRLCFEFGLVCMLFRCDRPECSFLESITDHGRDIPRRAGEPTSQCGVITFTREICLPYRLSHLCLVRQTTLTNYWLWTSFLGSDESCQRFAISGFSVAVFALWITHRVVVRLACGRG